MSKASSGRVIITRFQYLLAGEPSSNAFPGEGAVQPRRAPVDSVGLENEIASSAASRLP
jgi:hypothetical protein